MNAQINELTAQQKRAITIENKKIQAEALELETLEALQLSDELERLAAFEAIDILMIEEKAAKQAEIDKAFSINELPIQVIEEQKEQLFQTLENRDNFKSGLELSRRAIELSALADANDNISADKRRLTALNRVNRCKRFAKLQALSNDALFIISSNTTAEKIESTAIYAVDKVIQIGKFLSGESSIFGRGKNNSLMYLIRGIAEKEPTIITRDFSVSVLTRYGQPHESADTQASSSCKALLALQCLEMQSAGRYTINKDSKLMTLLLSEYSSKEVTK